MALYENAVPVLAVAIDNMPDVYKELIDSVSISDPAVKESEILSAAQRASDYFLSDVRDKTNRIYIPITDKILPIHYNSGTASAGKLKTYQEDKVTLTELGNTVSLRFEMKSSLSALSVIADIFQGLTDKINKQTTTSPRISFFSKTLCIFNAYLVGMNRATVDDTDQEILSLTLEYADDDVEDDETEETEEETFLKDPNTPDPGVLNILTDSAQVAFADINRNYAWYPVIDLQTLEDLELCEIFSTKNINRQDYRLFKVNSADLNGPRNMQSINYDREYISLEQTEGSNFSSNLGIMRTNDSLYLGLLRNES